MAGKSRGDGSEHDVYRVGLTGNIGSGKSTVAAVWRSLGAAVVDADELARRAMEPGTTGFERIVETFGSDVVDEQGRLDRGRLRRIVFGDEPARRRLESIIHPEVERLRLETEARLGREGIRIVVHEIPLLFEVGLDDAFDLLVLIDAPADVRLDRVVESRGLAESEARRMVEAQMSAERKSERADIVVDNEGTREELEGEAERTWSEIQRCARATA